MTATLVIENAAVLTMDELRPRAEAVAVAGNEIAAVGSNKDIAALKGPGRKVIDAQGATVLPGLHRSPYASLRRARRSLPMPTSRASWAPRPWPKS